MGIASLHPSYGLHALRLCGQFLSIRQIVRIVFFDAGCVVGIHLNVECIDECIQAGLFRFPDSYKTVVTVDQRVERFYRSFAAVID
jgi:hypothetical protein